jgi:hypothetical protein
MIKINVIFGKAECKAASDGLPHDSTMMEFETRQEAVAYIAGCSDSNGWEQVSVETDGTLDIPTKISENLWHVK